LICTEQAPTCPQSFTHIKQNNPPHSITRREILRRYKHPKKVKKSLALPPGRAMLPPLPVATIHITPHKTMKDKADKYQQRVKRLSTMPQSKNVQRKTTRAYRAAGEARYRDLNSAR
jgi:hypothetical protein